MFCPECGKPLPDAAMRTCPSCGMTFEIPEQPEMSAGEHSNIGVISFAIGFSLMMALDVALG